MKPVHKIIDFRSLAPFILANLPIYVGAASENA